MHTKDRVLRLIVKRGSCTKKEIVRSLKVSDSSVKAALKFLKEEGLVYRSGWSPIKEGGLEAVFSSVSSPFHIDVPKHSVVSKKESNLKQKLKRSKSSLKTNEIRILKEEQTQSFPPLLESVVREASLFGKDCQASSAIHLPA